MAISTRRVFARTWASSRIGDVGARVDRLVAIKLSPPQVWVPSAGWPVSQLAVR